MTISVWNNSHLILSYQIKTAHKLKASSPEKVMHHQGFTRIASGDPPVGAAPHRRLDPVAARQSTGLSHDAPALSGSKPYSISPCTKQNRRRLASVCLVHHQGFERYGRGPKTLRNGGLTALPGLAYPRNYPNPGEALKHCFYLIDG